MPCPIYCLPKDHKEECLKGRPIHAATDTPATSLSKLLARSLNSLLKHVPAHLNNTCTRVSETFLWAWTRGQSIVSVVLMFAIYMDPSHLRTLTPIRQVYILLLNDFSTNTRMIVSYGH